MRRSDRGIGSALVALTAAALNAGGARLAAQDLVQPDTAVPAGTVIGSVVAAQTGAPLDGAVVLLEPAPGGALSAAPRGPSFWEAGRVARTDANGAYRFNHLAVGRYQLHVRRLGYHPASLEIELGGHGEGEHEISIKLFWGVDGVDTIGENFWQGKFQIVGNDIVATSNV